MVLLGKPGEMCTKPRVRAWSRGKRRCGRVAAKTRASRRSGRATDGGTSPEPIGPRTAPGASPLQHRCCPPWQGQDGRPSAAMARRYFVDSLPPPGPASLRGDAVHHIWDVLRAGPGDEVILADGRGGECRARIDGRQRGELLLTAASALRVPPPRLRVHLAFAPPRLTRAEWLFEHG